MTPASPARNARSLYARAQQGILSTLSVELRGHPFGSVVTFVPDRVNRPLILISDLAQHTRNIKADPRVSLTLVEGGDDIQAGGRLTLVGSATPVSDNVDELAERHYRRFPQARDYHRAHDFAFYRIEPVRARYIGGFGSIHWLAADQLCLTNPFSHSVETAMIDHMNTDHASAIAGYCRLHGIDPQGDTPRISAIDGEGFDIMLGKRLLRIDFERPADTPGDVRSAMVAMALHARELSAA